MSEAEIRRKLKGRIAVEPGELPAKALGVGRHLLKQMIDDGTVPVNGVGNIPVSWLLRQMRVSNRKAERAA